ncbi:MAG: MarP family serine protease [Nostocoides sp.]
MSGGSWLDLGLVVLFVGYALTGYRQGFVVSVMSLAGFLGGGALAMMLMPWVLDHVSSLHETTLRRSLVVILGVFVFASLGQAVAVAVGQRIRRVVRLRSARVVDALLGAVVVVASTAVLAWFVAGAVRGGAPPVLAKAIGESRVLQTIDEVVPAQTTRLFLSFREALDHEGFPRVFEGISAEPIKPIAVPDGSAASTRAVLDAAGSIVKITGVSDACQQGQEGSGWVVAPGKVVTNAHVVAGLDHVTLRPRGTGRTYVGTVVLFDPARDLAVIDVPHLTVRPLPLGPSVGAGTSTVVAGFPLDGPYTVGAARVRDVLLANGADIYGQPGTKRQIYSLYATVRPGNSGGPLLDTRGEVVGIVFAKSLDDPNTGYALTLTEAQPVLDEAATASVPVSTGGCIRG